MPRIGLAVSRIGGVPGVGSAYHSSILIDGTEFFFSDDGIMRVPPRGPGCEEVASHVGVGSCTELFEMGVSPRLGRQLVKALGSFFMPGTYDFVRKNCNSFSDCALYFLLGNRLDPKYRQLDLIGVRMHSKLPSVLAAASMGTYSANEAADGFDVEATIEKLAAARSEPASPKRGRASRSSGKQLRIWSKESASQGRSYSKPCDTIQEDGEPEKVATRRRSLELGTPLEEVLPGNVREDSEKVGSDASPALPAAAGAAAAKDYRLRLAEDGDDDDDDGYGNMRAYSMLSIQEAASEVIIPQAKLVKRYVRRHSESAAQAIQKAVKGVRVCCVPTVVVGAEPERCGEDEQLRTCSKESVTEGRSYSKPCETILEDGEMEQAGTPHGDDGTRLLSLEFNIPKEEGAAALPGATRDGPAGLGGGASATTPPAAAASAPPAQDYRLRLAEEDDDGGDGRHNESRSCSMRSIQALACAFGGCGGDGATPLLGEERGQIGERPRAPEAQISRHTRAVYGEEASISFGWL